MEQGPNAAGSPDAPPPLTESAGLTAAQAAHFAAFGFLHLRQLLTPEELAAIAAAAERAWEACLGRRPGPGEAMSIAPFIEGQRGLDTLADHPQLYGPAATLLGRDLIWGGSEGNRGVLRGRAAHEWHADREGWRELDFLRLKCMIYLEPMRREAGALRLIPGSHRLPLHEDLASFRDRHEEEEPRYFGLSGPEVPAWAVETDPGDVVLLNQCLYHAVYGGGGRDRPYIALKYSQRPKTDAELVSVMTWSPTVFDPPEAFRRCRRARICGMVEGLAALKRRAERLQSASQ